MALRVVIIEPSLADRRWIQLMLRETGLEYSLQSFSSALAALEELREAPAAVHAVILNIVLPCMEAAAATARLRELPGFTAFRCAVTVLDELDIPNVPDGCEVLVKPVSAEALKRFLLTGAEP